MNLTQSQEHAFHLFQNFMSSESHCFILKGYAGTGKTYLLQYFIDFLKFSDCHFTLLAPTGRAANVLRERTTYLANTIHGCIYDLDLKNTTIDNNEEKQQMDYNLVFDLKENKSPLNMIYLVDESSMISDKVTEQEYLQFGSGKLLSDLIKYVNPIQSGRKIVFIGDDAQLPPVNTSHSLALDVNYLKEHFNLSTNEYQLTEVYRQSEESGILTAATDLREKIGEESFNYYPVKVNKKDLINLEMQEAIHQYVGQWKKSIFITETNSSTFEYTNYIRELLKLKDLSPGERLLVTKNTHTPSGDKLFNGDFIQVSDVLSIPEIRTVNFREKDEQITVDLVYRDIEIIYKNLENGRAYKEKLKIFENILWRKEVGLTKHERRAMIIDFEKRHKGVKRNSEEFKKLIINDSYFNAVQVRFGYVITCHKAQGGEWNTVYADMSYSQSIQCLSYFRWSYTVLTRAKNLINFVNLPIQAEPASENRFSVLSTILKESLKLYNAEILEEKESGYENIYYIRMNTNIYRIKIYRNKKDIITKVMFIDKGELPPFFNLFENVVNRSLYETSNLLTTL
ncbi:ATP-dependent DNA helicase [Ureibacillus acetophenoni]|uniref:UvrD-like helicase family protein n=1 Tax=Ureibacillus acetophenoni TaxID=614649 RepID=A0A285U559_9BACL|nr:AAA family ATPase [Ureibacillus acetophenoni]SOC37084.1 UvrD-like helicase family protein [Ureibacillus acetophenoni]